MLIFISVYCTALTFSSIICFALFCLITVMMVFYSNLCFIVNLMPFTVSAQPFRTMFYVSMHFCDFIVVCTSFPCVYSPFSCLSHCLIWQIQMFIILKPDFNCSLLTQMFFSLNESGQLSLPFPWGR